MKIALLLIFSIFLNSKPLCAEQGDQFFGKLATGGYLGRVQPALGYNFSKDWDAALGLGWTPALHNIVIYQLNLETRYNFFSDVSDGKLIWRPLHVTGAFIWALNKDFFIFSPDRYPEETYYEPTSIAFLLGLGTEVVVKLDARAYIFALWLSTSDRYVAAKFNNIDWNSAYCCSGGFSIKSNF